jgi:hypothetical protein
VAKEKIGTTGKPSIVDSISPLLDKVRGVRPGAAKESATRSAVSTKELVQLSIGYVKQETKQPLVGLLRFLQFGVVAAILIATGLVLLLLGLLRGIQAAFAYERVSASGVVERGQFSGSLSWLPYLLTLVGCLVALGLIALLARKSLRSNTPGGNQ